MDDIEIRNINELLSRADQPSDHSAFAAHKSLGAIILVCGKLLELIEDQERRIEHLEDALTRDTERKMS